MVLTVILMPYYLRPETKELMEQLAKAQAEAKATASALAEAKSEMERLQQQAAAMQSKLDKPFLVIAISWGGKGTDVDLHVTDPSGRKYSFEVDAYSESPAKLEVDSTHGPGNEVWIHPAATPGIYRVECVYFKDGKNVKDGHTGPVEIRGVAVHRDGRTDLPTIRIVQPNEQAKVLIAELEVSANGEVTIR